MRCAVFLLLVGSLVGAGPVFCFGDGCGCGALGGFDLPWG
jgi:hypothetical protein